MLSFLSRGFPALSLLSTIIFIYSCKKETILTSTGCSKRITLNLAVGGGFFGNPDPSTIQTGTMQVDWVKVFTSN